MAERAELIPVYIMGKRYDVPASLTIMKAMEWAGYNLVRGVGCRGGFCGACSTVYRIKDDPKLYFGLACQTVVKPEMYLGQIPFFPATRASYDITQLEACLINALPNLSRAAALPGLRDLHESMPPGAECQRVYGCGDAGDIEAVANMSFDCIMCGLCAARCPAEEPQYNIAILARRLYGRYLAPRSEHLLQRVEEISAGNYDHELAELKALDTEALKTRYRAREIEP
jgi:ferredoxin